jgi:hypothetical protein
VVAVLGERARGNAVIVERSKEEEPSMIIARRSWSIGRAANADIARAPFGASFHDGEANSSWASPTCTDVICERIWQRVTSSMPGLLTTGGM